MRILLLLVVTIFFETAVAQKIQVLEKFTKEPVPGVAVFNRDKTKNGITDFDGFLDISEFDPSEKIIFQHISHQKRALTRNSIKDLGNIVYLDSVARKVAKNLILK